MNLTPERQKPRALAGFRLRGTLLPLLAAAILILGGNAVAPALAGSLFSKVTGLITGKPGEPIIVARRTGTATNLVGARLTNGMATGLVDGSSATTGATPAEGYGIVSGQVFSEDGVPLHPYKHNLTIVLRGALQNNQGQTFSFVAPKEPTQEQKDSLAAGKFAFAAPLGSYRLEIGGGNYVSAAPLTVILTPAVPEQAIPPVVLAYTTARAAQKLYLLFVCVGILALALLCEFVVRFVAPESAVMPLIPLSIFGASIVFAMWKFPPQVNLPVVIAESIAFLFVRFVARRLSRPDGYRIVAGLGAATEAMIPGFKSLATERKSLVGCTAVVVSSEINEEAGLLTVTDRHGNRIRADARTDGGPPIPKDERVVLVDFAPDTNVFIVIPERALAS